MIKAVIATFLILIGSGCSTQSYVYPRLPEPTRPALVKISGEELQCISDDTAQKLRLRFVELRQYAEELETIIKTHNKGVKDD